MSETVPIPCLRPGKLAEENAPELVCVDDPAVSFYDTAAKASVRLLSEWQEYQLTTFGKLDEKPKGKTGSGTVVSSDGLILTCNHVIDQEGQLTVEFVDGQKVKGTVAFKFPDGDLALVQAENTGKHLPYLGLKSKEKFYNHQGVMVAGHPQGWQKVYISPGNITHIASADTIFNKKMPVVGMCGSQTVVKTDCHIEPGNSGSSLFNQKGEVIGVSFANDWRKALGSIDKVMPGDSFAIPISTLRKALKSRPDLLKRLDWN